MTRAYLAFTDTGLALARRLADALPGSVDRCGSGGVSLAGWTALQFAPYVNIPLYNTSTFVSASDDQKAQMLQLAQAAAASCSETQDGSVSEQVSALHSAASAALPDIYAVLDSTPAEDAASVQTELLTESDLTGAFTQDGAADAVRGLVYGEAAAVQYNAASIILMMRIDPLQVSTLDALRTQILSDMKGDELEDALTAYGSTLENDLSTSAMNKMPASKIVNPSSSSNS